MQKFKSKLKSFLDTFYFLLIFLTFNLLLLTFNKVHAVYMNSTLYRIDSANVSNGSGDTSGGGYKISDTLGQLAAGRFSSDGYIVKAGFQYLHLIVPFRFTISNTHINFGTLVPNTPSTATTNLTIDFGMSGQYLVTAIEEDKLKTLGGTAIPDTTCNGGDNTCNESTAKLWDSNSAYGFGYGMSGDDIPGDFSAGFYRPFPDRTANEDPATVMTSTEVGRNRTSTLTFKVNISPAQQSGSYQTIINFVATPSY